MYVYNKLVCDEATKKHKSKILRKIKYHGGMTSTYVITLAGGNDIFDLIPGYVFKQKSYPTKDLYIMGLADGYDAAVDLSSQMIAKFFDQYGSYDIKKILFEDLEFNFKHYGRK